MVKIYPQIRVRDYMQGTTFLHNSQVSIDAYPFFEGIQGSFNGAHELFKLVFCLQFDIYFITY